MVFLVTPSRRMSLSLTAIQEKDASLANSPGVYSQSSFPPPYNNVLPKESSHSSSPVSAGSRISPAVLFVIVILAAIFFISGLLHLLIRLFIKKPSSSSRSNGHPDISGSETLQRQLQQLFHLHDSGLDQAVIDALPVFLYKEIMGLKEPFDCAVCLCEFSENDKLRLLPICSHAFHMHCIDTWLLSNSTCPLCRGTLFAPGLAIENPMFDYYDQRDEGRLSIEGDSGLSIGQKTGEVEETVGDKKVFPVRLGKFRNMNGGEEGIEVVGETSSSNLDARRCFSMGSYQYVVGDSNLQVLVPKESSGGGSGQYMNSRGSNENPSSEVDMEGKRICNGRKGESFSVSKIWLWPRKGHLPSSYDSRTCITSDTNQIPDWIRRTQNV